MAELIPQPFASLVKRMFYELESEQSIFDFPAKKFFCGLSGKDYSVKFHVKRSSSPLGPASGPQTQMAQNILLSWLGGCRIMELKTVQILDELEIPRPCIDMQTVGYNVEWSQELRIEQSLHEYVKGAMLIEILQAS
ncbi:MAG: glutamate synthase, partial [SAR324 cluster bacterium]|nr:glutamate synthase [SAR324 cluster bacterium]